MDVNLRPSRRSFIFLLLLVTLLTAACGAQIGGSNWPGISADSDTLYFATGTELIALNPNNQQVKWRLPAASNTASLLAAPEISSSKIYIGDYGQSRGLLSPSVQASIFAVDKASSGELTIESNGVSSSEIASDRIIATPLLADDKLFVGTANNYLMALDSGSLSVIWGGDEPKFDHSIWGQPAYANGVVVATSLDTSVRAFNANTGEQLWRNDLGGAIAAGPVIVENTAIIAGFDAMVHAFDLQTGEESWAVEASNWIWNSPAVSGNTVYFGDASGVVYAVDANTGNIEWQAQQEGIVQAPLVAVGDQLIVPLVIGVSTDEQTGKMLSLSTADGSLQWQQDMTLPTFATPTVVQDMIVVVQTDISRQQATSELQAFDLGSGAKSWTWTLE